MVVPAYVAVTVLAPAGSDEICLEQLADPDVRVALQRVLPPEVKVTVPPVAADGVTVADRVSLEPELTVEGLTLADVEVAMPFTVRVKASV